MKFAIVFAALFAYTLAASLGQDVQILRLESDVQPDGFAYA